MTVPIQVARFVPRTDAEGPGRRFAVWVQGCSIRCPGCFNPQYWTTRGGREMTAAELFAEVPRAGADAGTGARAGTAAGIEDEVEGVTLLGGEPFEQAEALAPFAAMVRDAGLSVMAFTGYTLQQLHERSAAGDRGVAELLAATDLLIDGPYLRDEPDHERPWVGSRNQGFHTLTERYAHLNGQWQTLPDRVEVTVAADGTTAVNGWASAEALETLLEGLRRTRG